MFISVERFSQCDAKSTTRLSIADFHRFDLFCAMWAWTTICTLFYGFVLQHWIEFNWNANHHILPTLERISNCSTAIWAMTAGLQSSLENGRICVHSILNWSFIIEYILSGTSTPAAAVATPLLSPGIRWWCFIFYPLFDHAWQASPPRLFSTVYW